MNEEEKKNTQRDDWDVDELFYQGTEAAKKPAAGADQAASAGVKTGSDSFSSARRVNSTKLTSVENVGEAGYVPLVTPRKKRTTLDDTEEEAVDLMTAPVRTVTSMEEATSDSERAAEKYTASDRAAVRTEAAKSAAAAASAAAGGSAAVESAEAQVLPNGQSPEFAEAVRQDAMKRAAALSRAKLEQETKASQAAENADWKNYNATTDYDYDAGSAEEDRERELERLEERERRMKMARQRAEERMAERQAEEEAEKKKKKKKTLYGILIGIILLLVLLLVILIASLFKNNGGSKQTNNESSEQSVEDEAEDIQTMTGVVTAVDKSAGTITIYNVDTRMETTFTLQKDRQPDVSVSSFKEGDVVDISYDILHNNCPTGISTAKKSNTLNNISGVTLGGTTVSINEQIYTIDDHLICLYQGQEVDKSTITSGTTFNASVVGEHIYTITVTSSTGTLILQNLTDYAGAELKITPAKGETVTQKISGDTLTFEVSEGSLSLSVADEEETLFTYSTFITAGSENKVKLPDIEEKKGSVVFRTDLPEGVVPTITVDGRAYQAGESTEFEYGDYTASVSAQGYEDTEISFTVEKPYTQVNIELQAKTVTVYVASTPPGVSLYVDGVYQGSMVLDGLTLELEYGTYELMADLEGYETEYREITLDENSSTMSIVFYMIEIEESSEEIIEESSEAPAEESSEETPAEESSEEVPAEESSEETPAEESSEAAETGETDETSGNNE